MNEFTVDENGLYRTEPMMGEHVMRCVLTKEEFIACYNAWIKNTEHDEIGEE